MPLTDRLDTSPPLLRAAAAVLALSVALGCARAPSTEQLMQDARRYEQQGDIKAAVIQLKNVLQQDPKHAEARFRLATLYRSSSDPRSAEKELREALAAGYDSRVVIPMLAEALFQQGEFQKVIDETRSSDHGEVVLSPRILSMRGHAQLSVGDRDSAAASFEEALKRQSDFPDALLGQLRMAMLGGDAVTGLRLAERAVAADPKSLDGWLMKGDLERALGRPEAALASFGTALALAPDNVAVNLNLASMALAAGKVDVARKHVEAIRRAVPDSPLGYYLLGLIEFRSGNLKEADAAVEEVLKSAPRHLPATALAGAVAYARGANDAALQLLKTAYDRAPTSPSVRKIYAAALLKARKSQAAIEILEPLVVELPEDMDVALLTGEAYFQAGEIAKAKPFFERAAKHDPKNPRSRAGLGLARLAVGETERALADLEAAIDYGGAGAEIYLVTTLLAQKQVDKAVAAVIRIEAKRPKDPLTYNLKGATLLAKKDLAGARQAFERALELDPGHVPAALNLAQIELREGKPDAAQARFEKILARDNSNVEAMMALASLAARQGSREDAVRWLERAKQASPKAFGPALALARGHFSNGEYAAAAAAAQDALAIQPESGEALNLLGYSQFHLGKRSESLNTFSRLAALYPKSAQALYALSTAQAAMGNLAGAEISLRKALAEQPSYPDALVALASLEIAAGRVAEAHRLAADALKRFPRLPIGHLVRGDAFMAEKKYLEAARAYDAALALTPTGATLIRWHGAMSGAGKPAEASARLNEWLKIHPEDVVVRLHLADAGIKAGDCRLAVEQYEIVLSRQPRNLALMHNLVWCYARLHDRRALEVAERAYAVSPDNPQVLADLAGQDLESGNVERAIRLLEKALVVSPQAQDARFMLAKAYLRSGDRNRARKEFDQLLRGSGTFAERAEAAALLKGLKN